MPTFLGYDHEHAERMENWRNAGREYYVFRLTDFVTYLNALNLPEGTPHRELIDWGGLRAIRKEIKGRYSSLAKIRNDIAHPSETMVEDHQFAKRVAGGVVDIPGVVIENPAAKVMAQMTVGNRIVHTSAESGTNELEVSEAEAEYLVTAVARVDKAFSGALHPFG